MKNITLSADEALIKRARMSLAFLFREDRSNYKGGLMRARGDVPAATKKALAALSARVFCHG